jgi:sigma-54-specific transcriptional regulator
LETLIIQRAWETGSRNQVRTARLLGISRNLLRTYLKRCGLIGSEPVGTATAAAPSEEPDAVPSYPACTMQ